MDKDIIQKIFNIHKNYIYELNEIIKETKVKIRLPNFPEILSENLVKFYIQDFENRNCINSKCGD